jgi:MFS transporter, MHS family, shikimate and dehydroshikimate transport protein
MAYPIVATCGLEDALGSQDECGLASHHMVLPMGRDPAIGCSHTLRHRRRLRSTLSAVLAVPLFLMLDTGNFFVITVALSLGLGIGHGSMYGAQGALFANLYPVNVRYTGLSITQQFGATLGGGLSPLIGALLLAAAGGHWSYVIFYCVGVAALSSLAASRLRKGEALPAEVATAEPVLAADRGIA